MTRPAPNKKARILQEAMEEAFAVLRTGPPDGLICRATLESDEPKEHGCPGCQYEWKRAVKVMREALLQIGSTAKGLTETGNKRS